MALEAIDGTLYAGLGVDGGDAEVWSYTPGQSWTKIGGDGVNSSWSGHELVSGIAGINGKIYVGMSDVGFVFGSQSAEVWEFNISTNTWTWVGGSRINSSWTTELEVVGSMRALNGYLYVGTGGGIGDGELWRYTPGGTWAKVAGKGINGSWTNDYEVIDSLIDLDGKLYIGLGIASGNAEVWRFTP
jgi:hypothetical protein